MAYHFDDALFEPRPRTASQKYLEAQQIARRKEQQERRRQDMIDAGLVGDLTPSEVARAMTRPWDPDEQNRRFADHIRKQAGDAAGDFAASAMRDNPFPEPRPTAVLDPRRTYREMTPMNNAALARRDHMVNNRIMTQAQMENAVANMAALMQQVMQSQSLAARFPSEPPKGSVLRFERKFSTDSSKVCFYVAYRMPNGRWVMTGNDGDSRPSWEDLQTLIGNEDVQMSTEWTDVPKVDQDDFDKIDDPKAWFEANFMPPKPNAKSSSKKGDDNVIDVEDNKDSKK